MPLIDSYTLSQDATFVSKVRMACIKAANAVIAANTAAQMDTARRVLADPAEFAATVAGMIAISDTTVAAAAPTGSALTDVQIQTAVNTYLATLVR